MEIKKENTYERPAMKFVSIRNEESVANTCWGYHGKNINLYYDSKGAGWMSFQIDKGPCAMNLINVTYYKDSNDASGTSIAPGTDKYQELWDALVESGGNDGNPYSGERSTVFPENPEKTWS